MNMTKDLQPDQDDGLKCTICNKIYNNPMMLCCMHTFCEGCIYQKVSFGIMSNIVFCPTCQYVTKVGEGGKLPLWRNHVVQQKVKKHIVNSMRENNLLYCTDCESDRATQLCCDCQWKLCDGCTSHHKKCVRYKDHNIQSIESVSTEALYEPESIICQKHKQELKYVCETCEVATCSDCTHSKVHQGHSFRLMEEVMEEKIESLNQLISTSRLNCKRYEDYMMRMEDFQKRSKQDNERSRKIVEETFNEVITALQAEKNKLLMWLEESYESSEKVLCVAKEEMKVVQSATDYMEEVIKFPKEEVSDVVLEGVRRLKKAVENMDKASPPLTPSPPNLKNQILQSSPTFSPFSAISNPFFQNRKRKNDSETSATNASSKLATDHENVFDVKPRSRQINVSGHLEKIKLAMTQISFLQQKETPEKIFCTDDSRTVYLNDRGGNPCLPCAFSFSEKIFSNCANENKDSQFPTSINGLPLLFGSSKQKQK